MKILIAGEHPFALEIRDLCRKSGLDTTIYLIEDFFDAIESGYVMDELPKIDVAIEIHNEAATAKQELLMNMSYGLKKDALILTSALPVSATQAGAWVPNAKRVVGFSLLPPIRENTVVEVAAGMNTEEKYVKQAVDFWKKIGLECQVVQDGTGLLLGRIIGTMVNEAIYTLYESGSSAKQVDEIVRHGANFPHGPLEWADYIGLDALLGLLDGLFAETNDSRFRPCPLLRRMVVAGHLGRKSGRGFYEYE